MNDLLKVLDMSEKEQRKWLLVNYFHQRMPCVSNADLAFRLRDEVKTEDFHNAIYEVMLKVEGNDNWATAFWGGCLAKPIHWIIAALIAKEQK